MKLKDILKKVGSGIIRDVVPGGGVILDVVNGFLPDGKKLPKSATASDVTAAISTWPAEEQAALLGREFDVEETQIKESNESLRVMLEADAKSEHSTRPYIAKHSFHVLAVVSVLVVSTWTYGVVDGDSQLVKQVMDGWPFILAVVGPFAGLLSNYFGVLKREHQTRMNAANGQVSGLGSAISGLLQGRGK